MGVAAVSGHMRVAASQAARFWFGSPRLGAPGLGKRGGSRGVGMRKGC